MVINKARLGLLILLALSYISYVSLFLIRYLVNYIDVPDKIIEIYAGLMAANLLVASPVSILFIIYLIIETIKGNQNKEKEKNENSNIY